MVRGDGWLQVGEVVDAFREAGWGDSASTIRRLIDKGHFGETWVSESGYRHVSAASVALFLSKRPKRAHPPVQPPD